MSWAEKSLDAETLKSILNGVWQDVPSILDAPKRFDPNFSESEESEKFYKAIDTKGNIYLAQNPALMLCQCMRFESPIKRVKSKFVMSVSDAKKDQNKFRYSSTAVSQNNSGVDI